MRNAFASEVTALAGTDPRLVLLSGVIGNRLFDKFKSAYEEQRGDALKALAALKKT